MPTSPGDAPPRTPNRRASASHILTAFLNLTSKSTPKSATQDAALQPALTPIQTTSTAGQEASTRRQCAEYDLTSTVSQAVSEDAVSLAHNPAQRTVLAGPPQLTSLLAQLTNTRPLPERVGAALKLGTVIDQYGVTDRLAVWSLGEDLLDNASDEAFQAGMALLRACAGANGSSANERHALYDSLVAASRQGRHLALQAQVLHALTDGGRTIEAIEQDVLARASGVLHSYFDAIQKERREKRLNGVGEESTLRDLFRLVSSTIKFNAQVLDDSQLNFVVQTINAICQATTAPQDVENSVDIVVTLLTFTSLSAASLRSCLELISDIYRQVQLLRARIWDVVSNIFTSHLGPLAVDIYLQIVRSGGHGIKRMVCRGAFRLLAHLCEMNGKHGLPTMNLGVLLAASEEGLNAGDPFLAQDFLAHTKELLFRDDLKVLLQEEPEWDTFVRCLKMSSDALDLNPFLDQLRGFKQDAESEASDSASLTARSDRWNPKRGKSYKDVLNLEVASRNLHDIITKLTSILTNINIIHKDAVVRFLLSLASRVSNVAAEVLVTCCAEERLAMPASPEWTETGKTLIVSFVHDSNRPRHLRTLTISIFRQSWDTIELVTPEFASELAQLMLRCMPLESDAVVLDALADFAVMVVDRADPGLFEALLTIFRVTVFQRRQSRSASANLSPTGGLPVGVSVQIEASLCRTASKHVVRMFIHSINRSARKAEALFSFILKVAASSECAVDARICALKLLFRLRATGGHAVYIRPLSESERLAAVLCRTAETVKWPDLNDAAAVFDSKDNSSATSVHSTTKQRTFDVRRPVPPLWFYPGPKGLPEEPSLESSIFVYSFSDPMDDAVKEEIVVLQIALWLETIISLLQQADIDWEIYSYLIVHLGAQLANQNLFRGCIRQIRLLRSVLCDQIRAASFHEPPSYTSLKKADVAVCLYQTLTMLVGYHDHFARSEEDELVRTFTQGVGSWDRTSKWCIHALSLCCHELPLSVSKMLDSVIQKMSQIITQAQIAVHILEFLVMLARLPDLYKNFREDEYKMVFGVSFRYLQYVRDIHERDLNKDLLSMPARHSKMQMRHSDSFRELRPLHDDARVKGRRPDDLPQYVYALAFHVITFWFMNLRLDDRPMYVPWITKNLTYLDSDGEEIIEDQGIVTVDMMDKVAYTDRDETAYDPGFATEIDGEILHRTWIIGLSLVTIETAGRTGVSQITRRRPSGTKYSVLRPALTSPPRHQVPLTFGLAADAFYTSSYTGVLPEDVIQELYSSYNLLETRAPRPVPLPDDEGVARAINSFDRNSTVDGHKVGVIFIGENQSTEAEILSNTHGSTDYTTFVSKLGFLTRLKGARFNTQGLDRTDDTDGRYTYCWRDRATEIVFHITTMMPTDLEHDPQCVHKKSHIGNDFVNIVWNDSGQDFKFDTFPSAFNYVYIVITPESMQSFTTLRGKDHTPDRFYKVRVISAPGFPEISPAAELKLLSAKALPEFIRLLALNASVFSLVWQNREGGEHFSPWRNRLREIKRLREKYVGSDSRALHVLASPANGAKIVPPSTMEKAQSESLAGGALTSPPSGRERGGSALSHRLSHATFSGSEDLSRSSLTTSSAGD